MKRISFALAIATMTLGAHAAQNSFEGAYGQLGIGFQSTLPSISSSNAVANTPLGAVNAPVNVSAGSSNNFTGTVTVGYMGQINQSLLLGIGAEYSPIAGNKTNYSGSVGPVLGKSTPLSAQYNTQDSYNLFISSATPIGKDGLLYGKVGYTGAAIKNTFGSSSTINYDGYSLGLGYKQIIKGGLYGFAEANYFSYGNQSKSANAPISVAGQSVAAQSTLTSSANACNLLLGVGYKF